MPHKILIYDGTFQGLLTCIFQIYEEKIVDFNIHPEGNEKPDFFAEKELIYTDTEKSKRVLQSFQSYTSKKAVHRIYRSFLSEIPGIEIDIVAFFQHIFKHKTDLSDDFSYPPILKIAQIDRKVGREKHRMEAFIRFEMLKDGIFFAKIAPDFNVLPLILKHFKNRYADQKWIIYDEKRKFGLYYNLKKVEPISLNFNNNSKNEADILHNEEISFQKLWKSYFTSTNIKSRKNSKLHLQHVPKRYWKYLTEKTTVM
ncbi:TIGR03915 family putative DNA repair protein [Zunongwangia sp. HRR-M8]|uniref:TIGR03915 family putative DNA repair protein n=1 Tax=Zunongwangia sp. HRR-M8 TaxID=3015170 RepID=UPI0022DCEF48|nr:TIGR03915 family putative DNA repair protein [Zunongwangia sp. HRR-M8]WBL23056.1 TIGR03915 family putative DNA repair protein [Zunongwangia sp. HRR-M8]